MKNNVIKNLFIAEIIAMGFATVSCTSNKVAVTDTMTSREIVQQAQNAYDNGNAKLAEQYYKTLLTRYGNDTSIYVEGRFELAHIYVKQKEYKKALPMLQEIITIYDNSEPGQLPGSYRKLAENDLKKIPDEVITASKKVETVETPAAETPAAETETTGDTASDSTTPAQQ